MNEGSKRRLFSRLGFRDKTSSLFVRLLVSFLLIIALLVSFIWFSVVFYRGSIKDELIKYNTLNLKNTTDSYESVFALIQNSVLSFSLKPELQLVQGEPVNYVRAVSAMQDTQFFLNNRLLYLNNLLLMYKDAGFALEKSRGAEFDTMFTRYYNSPDYTSDFWKDQFQNTSKFHVLPASSFGELERTGRSGVQTLIPIVVKNEQIPNFYMLALADADQMYTSLHHSINDNFYVLNERNERLYASSSSAQVELPAFTGLDGFVKKDSNYYFYMKGKSGFTYVNMIPDTSISDQVRWNFSFVLLLILTISISVLVSFLLSIRLNTPVKRIIDAIQKWNTPLPWASGIKEFNIIHDKISDILKTSRDIHDNMSEKESLLRYYAYSNMLKKIRNQHIDSDPLFASDRPFVLLLFQVNYKSMLHQLDVKEDRATSFIREYVNRIVWETYPDSLTFQMENDQILSIVFTSIEDPNIVATLGQIKHVLDTEREYCFLSITASGGTDDWNEAYRNGLQRLRMRLWNDETQIVLGLESQEDEVRLSAAQEEEFDANLASGNEAAVLTLVKRLLAQMRKKEAGARNVLSFAENVVLRTQKALQLKNIDPSFVQQALIELPNRHTYERLEELLSLLITSACQSIKERKDKRDHIIHFVYDYLEEHYEKDITLDAIAEKLNITRSYLSTYFKEKTGIYFVDYVNSVRINKAKKLLLKPEIRIQDAATLVGYQNINSFNRMFKKFTGVTPSEFRKNEIR